MKLARIAVLAFAMGAMMIPPLAAGQDGDYEPYEPYEPNPPGASNIPQQTLAASAIGCPFVNFNGIRFQGNSSRNAITGTALNDLLRGGSANDVVIGLRGDDCLFGQADADHIVGSRGNDTMRGNSGKDSMFGSLGTDSMRGGSGPDKMVGGRGPNDDLRGGKGDDFVKSADGRVDLPVRCGPGEDVARIDPIDEVAGSCETVEVVLIIVE